ncbi:MAG TPA: hypothetical protein DCP64_01105 [Sarcina sp.]|nr:hypothetical protein [Sarcina sp.]
MEKPYQIEDEKDLADTRYRWQYRAGMTVKHISQAKIKKAVRRERTLAKTAFIFLLSVYYVWG